MSPEPVSKAWRIPDELWERIEPLLPRVRKSKKGGRPPVAQRPVLDGIFYVLRTGCQWNAVPRDLGASTTVYRYFRKYVEAGVFRKLWKAGLMEYDELKGIHWDWQSIDGAMTKAPLGGEKYGAKPHGSREVRHEALPPYRWRRRSAGHRRRRSKHS